MTQPRLILLAVILLLAGTFLLLDLQDYLTLSALKSHQAAIAGYRDTHPILAASLYVVIYVAITSLSLPGAAVLTLAGGAIFGLFWGTLLASFASSIGATLAFLAARFVFRALVQEKLGTTIKAIDEGIDKDGAYYLFTLRLVPLFPFFVINLAMGLTKFKILTFYWVSQIGMLAGTLVYVNAGTQLAKLDSLAGILSPVLVGSFVLLGAFPFVAKKIAENLPRDHSR